MQKKSVKSLHSFCGVVETLAILPADYAAGWSSGSSGGSFPPGRRFDSCPRNNPHVDNERPTERQAAHRCTIKWVFVPRCQTTVPKNKDRMAKDMIISTSRLNCYGSRVMTAGIDIEQYKKNPVLLWMHRRSFGSGSPLPIGRVENLRFEGDALKGTPVFDENDPFAKQIADKWENGFLKMCSAGIDIIETSVDPTHLLPGQTRATVCAQNLPKSASWILAATTTRCS